MGSRNFSSPAFLKSIILVLSCALFLTIPEVESAKHSGITRHYKFDVSFYCLSFTKNSDIYTAFPINVSVFFLLLMQIKLQNVTRLCQTKSIVTVNGKFPGPRIIAREGDRLLIKVVNHVQNNITLHW